MKNLNRNVVWLKVFIDRARMYVGYINFFLLNAVFLQSFDIRILQSDNALVKFLGYGLIVVLGSLLLVLIGYLDHILGIRKEEMKNHAENNPIALKMLSDLEEIKEAVKRPDLNSTASGQLEEKS